MRSRGKIVAEREQFHILKPWIQALHGDDWEIKPGKVVGERCSTMIKDKKANAENGDIETFQSFQIASWSSSTRNIIYFFIKGSLEAQLTANDTK